MSAPDDKKPSSIDSQPEKKKQKMESSEKSGEKLPSSIPSSFTNKEMVSHTESEPSLEAFEDEIAAEAYREEQELVFHVFSKSTTSPVSVETSNSSSSSKSSNSSKSSSNSTSFDDTQSLRVDPVTGHQCVFPNLMDETSLASNLETTLSLRANYITGSATPASSMPSKGQSSKAETKRNSPSLKTTKSSGKDALYKCNH